MITWAPWVLPALGGDSSSLWSAVVQAEPVPDNMRVPMESGSLGQQIATMLHRALFSLSLGGDGRCLPTGNPGLFPQSCFQVTAPGLHDMKGAGTTLEGGFPLWQCVHL